MMCHTEHENVCGNLIGYCTKACDGHECGGVIDIQSLLLLPEAI